MSEDGWPSAAVKAAFNMDRRPTRDPKATAAVNDAKQLFPSKVKELGKHMQLFRALAAIVRLRLTATHGTLLVPAVVPGVWHKPGIASGTMPYVLLG